MHFDAEKEKWLKPQVAVGATASVQDSLTKKKVMWIFLNQRSSFEVFLMTDCDHMLHANKGVCV